MLSEAEGAVRALARNILSGDVGWNVALAREIPRLRCTPLGMTRHGNGAEGVW